MNRVYFITGASSGFGRALAEAVLIRGDKAVLAARRFTHIEELAAQYKDKAIAVKLDVTNSSERRQAVKSAVEAFGRVDVLANIAGQGSLGALEEFTSEQIRKQFEVNFFGVLEMTNEEKLHLTNIAHLSDNDAAVKRAKILLNTASGKVTSVIAKNSVCHRAKYK
jgi:NAD(P)-dependent dehydrogenase (short-subunit alcohol dehydrogenase family)